MDCERCDQVAEPLAKIRLKPLFLNYTFALASGTLTQALFRLLARI
jgi:hypothetical protein